MFESVCYVITLKYDLKCKHCYVHCGPTVNYTLNIEDVDQMVKIAPDTVIEYGYQAAKQPCLKKWWIVL